MGKTATQWAEKPKLPPSHYVDSRTYTDQVLFDEEREKIFNKTWYIACHESEILNAFDYRTFKHPGGTPLIIVRGEDMRVRTFYNICPRRPVRGHAREGSGLYFIGQLASKNIK